MLPHCGPAVCLSLLHVDDLNFALMLKGQMPFPYMKIWCFLLGRMDHLVNVTVLHFFVLEIDLFTQCSRSIPDRRVLHVEMNKSIINTDLNREGLSWNTGVIVEINNYDST